MRRRPTIVLFVTLFLSCTGITSLVAGGEEEAAASSTRGKYLAGQGIIIPPDEVHINSYIASIDYNYPKPSGAVGIQMYTGNRLLSTFGGEAIVHVGIQAAEKDFEDLPPMNLAFVIDKSGSMNSGDKMGWVKDAFAIFIEKIRPIDFVSLITFDNTANVVFTSTRMESRDKRLEFKSAVEGVMPGGGTNLVAGLELGYQQVMANFRSEFSNRVLFLTDGVGDSGGILDMAANFREMGINVSTFGVGTDFDLDLMVNLAKAGGGSSRFISDREEMEETFGSELDRAVVAAVRDLTMRLELPRGYEVIETWGYNNQILEREARYYLPTLHHRDYETILARISVPQQNAPGVQTIARFSATYSTDDGEEFAIGPYGLDVEFTDQESPLSGFSNAMVLQSGTMLHFAQDLKTIGELYYSCRNDMDRANAMRDELWRNAKNSDTSTEITYEEISSPELEELENDINARMRRALDLSTEAGKELENARLRLDNTGFDDEIEIARKYIEIIGRDLELGEDRMKTIVDDKEIAASVTGRGIEDHLQNLFHEIGLSFASQKPGVIAVSEFTTREEGKAVGLLDLLNEMAISEISKLDTLTIVERNRFESIIEEQKLALSGLMDTETAIEVGKLSSANYILTGNVIEMPSTVMIFGRIINVESGEIESVAQVIVPKDDTVKSLLM